MSGASTYLDTAMGASHADEQFESKVEAFGDSFTCENTNLVSRAPNPELSTAKQRARQARRIRQDDVRVEIQSEDSSGQRGNDTTTPEAAPASSTTWNLVI